MIVEKKNYNKFLLKFTFFYYQKKKMESRPHKRIRIEMTEMTTTGSDGTKIELVRCMLEHIKYNKRETIPQVSDSGILDVIMDLLRSDYNWLVERSMVLVQQLCEYLPRNSDRMIQHGIVPFLLEKLQNNPSNPTRIINTLVSMCNTDNSRMAYINSRVVPVMLSLEGEAGMNVLIALTNTCNEQIKIRMCNELLPFIINLLKAPLTVSASKLIYHLTTPFQSCLDILRKKGLIHELSGISRIEPNNKHTWNTLSLINLSDKQDIPNIQLSLDELTFLRTLFEVSNMNYDYNLTREHRDVTCIPNVPSVEMILSTISNVCETETSREVLNRNMLVDTVIRIIICEKLPCLKVTLSLKILALFAQDSIIQKEHRNNETLIRKLTLLLKIAKHDELFVSGAAATVLYLFGRVTLEILAYKKLYENIR